MQAILLAAGRGSRFGGNKLLHPLADGTPVALAAAGNLMAVFKEVLAVVNGDDAELMALLDRAGLQVTVCPTSDRGMGASLAWGVSRSADADGWLIALADMPWLKAETIRRVADAASHPTHIAAPEYRGRRGHPVAFGRSYGSELMALGGDQGARSLFAAHAAEVALIPCDDAGVVRDIDLREDASIHDDAR